MRKDQPRTNRRAGTSLPPDPRHRRRPKARRLGNGRPKPWRRPTGRSNSLRLGSHSPASDRRALRRGSASQRLLWRSVDSHGHHRPPRPPRPPRRGSPAAPVRPLRHLAAGPITRRRPPLRTAVGGHPVRGRRRTRDGRRRKPAGPDRAGDRPNLRPAGPRPPPNGARRRAHGLLLLTAGGRRLRPAPPHPAGRTGLTTPTTARCSPCWRSPSPCWSGSSAQ